MPTRFFSTQVPWVYRKDHVIMKDRAASVATRASGDVDVDFSKAFSHG